LYPLLLVLISLIAFSILVENIISSFDVWIGLNDIDIEGTFVWVDLFAYTQGGFELLI